MDAGQDAPPIAATAPVAAPARHLGRRGGARLAGLCVGILGALATHSLGGSDELAIAVLGLAGAFIGGDTYRPTGAAR